MIEDKRFSVLWRIAELYTKLVDPLNGPGGVRGTGESPISMPPTYTQTVVEYERLVKLLRDDRSLPLLRLEDGTKASARSCWWHLEHWHHRAQRVIRHMPVTKPGKKGRPVTLRNADGSPVTVPTIVWLRDDKADVVRAKRAVQWCCENWKLDCEPFLPVAVLEPMRVAA